MLSDILRFATVVVIDDVRANLRLLESSLKAFGLREVKAFSDSAEGLAWLQANPWDLLLLDLSMPAPNGFEILQQLAARDRSCAPVIIVTALNGLDDRRRGLELGANDFICKPLDLPDLLLRVRNNLQLSLASQALQQERDQLEQRVQDRTEQLRASFQALIRSLSRAASYKDNETGDHILRIGESAALIARAMGLDSDWIEQLRLAAPMHDIGKIGIPDAILNKPGRLDSDERQRMNQHAQIGYDILHDQQHSPLTDLAAEIAVSHHERWDGSGYPNGLKGEDIPLSGRIVAICDVYDALRSSRPYKQAWSAERAQAYILENAGGHFDPHLVQVMSSLFVELEALQLSMADRAEPFMLSLLHK
jgi:putative two-component system response regulator